MASRNSRNEHCRGRETRERAPVTQPRMRPPNWLTVRAFRVARACPGRRRTDPRACPADAGSVPRPRGAHLINDEDTPYRELCRMRWAALIKRVYQVDPLHCPDCVRRENEDHRLHRAPRPARCCREDPETLWIVGPSCLTRPPPRKEPEQLDLELQYVDTDEFLMAL